MIRLLLVAATGLVLTGSAGRAGDPGAFPRTAAPVPAMPIPPAAPPYLPVPAFPIVREPVPYVDLRTGRCIAGFAENVAGVCVRHDEPRVVCGSGGLAPGACVVAMPDPRPYGLGPSLRLNY